MPIQVDIRVSNADHAMGVWKGVVLYNWRARTTARGRGDVQALTPLAGKNGVGLLFGVVESGCKPPEGAVRDGLAKMLEALNGKVVASALTFDGKGFQAATVRFVAMALSALARPGYRHRAFGDVTEAAQFLNQEIAARGLTPYPTADLVEALTTVRKSPVR